MKAQVKEYAMQKFVSHTDKRPSRRAADRNYWQTAQSIHPVILANFVAEKKAEKQLFEKTMLLEAD